jgi:hypothetical protein
VYQRNIIVALLVFGIMGCTTLAAPPTGTTTAHMLCEDGSLKVCTGFVGSKIKKETPSCSCH